MDILQDWQNYYGYFYQAASLVLSVAFALVLVKLVYNRLRHGSKESQWKRSPVEIQARYNRGNITQETYQQLMEQAAKQKG